MLVAVLVGLIWGAPPCSRPSRSLVRTIAAVRAASTRMPSDPDRRLPDHRSVSSHHASPFTMPPPCRPQGSPIRSWPGERGVQRPCPPANTQVCPRASPPPPPLPACALLPASPAFPPPLGAGLATLDSLLHHLLTPAFVVPQALNLCGSVLFAAALGSSDISVTAPVANGAPFADAQLLLCSFCFAALQCRPAALQAQAAPAVAFAYGNTPAAHVKSPPTPPDHPCRRQPGGQRDFRPPAGRPAGQRERRGGGRAPRVPGRHAVHPGAAGGAARAAAAARGVSALRGAAQHG